MTQDSMLHQLRLQMNGALFENKKSHQMIVPNFRCDVMKEKLAGFCLTAALKDGSPFITAFCVKDPPDTIPLLEAINI